MSRRNGHPGGLGHLRLLASYPNSLVFPYPRSGFDKYAGGARAPPQPRSITSGFVTNFEQLAVSPGNKEYLRREVLRRFNGALSEDPLLRTLDEAVGWYKHVHLMSTPGYGPQTQEELQRALTSINERFLQRIGQLYQAQRVSTAHWLRTMHRPYGSDMGMPKYDDDYDRSLELGYD